MKRTLKYRLALDLGSTSLGWVLVKLDADSNPCAVIKAGVRIFSDGRNPKDGSSLAVTRRAARSMRRRRDRLLKRKARMMRTLIAHGFFPSDEAARKALERINPYALRAKGLDEALKPEEFARALFHINQRRGFKSNRKTDKKEKDGSAMQDAIRTLHQQIDASGANGKARTVGELLWRRMQEGSRVRARNNGLQGAKLQYELYIDRAVIEAEFDAIWARQSALNPAQFHEQARVELKDCLLYQRPLKPVLPGRCTLLPDEFRAPLALPSQQRFRIYQEINNLRLLGEHLVEESLTLKQRDDLAAELDLKSKLSFTQMRKRLELPGTTQFNLEDVKREELKGNTTCAILAKKEHFGDAWWQFDEARQDAIVMQLLTEENEAELVRWLQAETGVDEACAEILANVSLPEGYGSLSAKALACILPCLRAPDEQGQLRTYDKAVLAAGFAHHSDLGFEFEHDSDEVELVGKRVIQSTGEVKAVYAFKQLPYYGRALQRHVAFPKDKPRNDEERYGKIANPTVHIGLNQVRVVVNALIKRYGRPAEVIVEVARELKQNKEQREEAQKRQASNQKRNERLRKEAAAVLQCSEAQVRRSDIEKLILWEELSANVADRRCPYSGAQLSKGMVLSSEVEIEHILPFSQTLDDSLNNKTVATREANRIKGNNTPWKARADFAVRGWNYEDILSRAEQMPKGKRYRFAADGYEKWLRDDKEFLARALNDTRYLSRVAREYLSLICPQGTRVIPGQMTAMLRAKFGLNDILGLQGEKNRNDHRHHAVDACVIAVTDQGMLKNFADASADARKRQLNRLVESMPLPWTTYREHVERAIRNIWVSHKPDHDYQDELFDQTIYNAQGFSRIAAKVRSVIPFSARQGSSAEQRHKDKRGQSKPYKGLLSNSNYCIEIVRSGKTWEGEVIPTYKAYEFVREFKKKNSGRAEQEAFKVLRSPDRSIAGKSLVMRLSIDDAIRAEIDGVTETLQVLKINSSGAITFIKVNETNIPGRYASKLAAQKMKADGKDFDEGALKDEFFQKSISASSLREFKARRVTISPIGELRDPGFKE